ncbi:DUF4276 family protein [Pararhodospirillum oryzae]|uniref:DUF4276 family protein n=1 Tax=Pararhodospirillum oryzae TaxID=478448 RepID=UPI001C3F9080|nr:DUF4276 family protein [Pararhodospirillum oryzae]
MILVEEESMQILLRDILLPRLVEDADQWITVVRHRGKTDLRKQIPVRLRSRWPEGTRFMILHDQDQAECRALKAELLALCREAGRPETLVRIVCHELESWYLGDLEAVGRALGQESLGQRAAQEKFREPDRLANAKQEMERLFLDHGPQGYKPRSGARAIGPHMDPARNRSHSFQVFIRGVVALAAERRV